MRGFPKALVIGVWTLLAAVAAAAFEPLPRTSPGALGVDAAALEGAIGELSRVNGARSVVVVYAGRVVGEAHWYGDAATLHDVRSVTKSVSSTLVGIAIDRGFIGSLDDRMVDYLPPSLIPSDRAKDAITVRHLVTMSAGFEWNEDTDLYSWSVAADPARFILDRPLSDAPGSRFHYNTAAAHLLSVVLREATGVDPLVFADDALLAPLGITERGWLRDRRGRPFGGHGFRVRTEDLAKLGVLFLRSGRWEGEQVVPAQWVRLATSPAWSGFGDYGPLAGIGYGRLWWLADAEGWDVFTAWGWGGQFAFCVPALDLVVATTSRWNVGETTANAQETAVLEVIASRFLPLFPVRRRPVQRARGRLAPVVAGGGRGAARAR